ncbi:cardiolipin synthase [uncultured Alsobacter sp.]|uniref:cardiolipin synthase n=1 Tax=uncultured Alsobacter sp. TaxID=1748258 RepID=UPI0025F91982|nr:cardiolipin synthase [uncultured Alsobacter sp.]
MTATLWSLLPLALHTAVVIVAFLTVPINRKPSSATAWLLLIVAAPFVGVMLFLAIGSPKLPARRRKLQRQMTQMIAGTLAKAGSADLAGPVPPQRLGERGAPFGLLAERLGGMPPMEGNTIAFLHGYDGIVAEMVASVARARHYVHVEFYIVALDATTEPLFAALEAAVARGVTVRLLLDQMGSRKFPRRKEMEARMTAAGIQWRYMLPLLNPREFLRIDLRNHRKILVIDSLEAYTGSLNLIEKAYHRSDDLFYEELGLRLTGPAVFELEAVFVTDWYSESGELLDASLHPPVEATPFAPGGGVIAQVLPSGSGFDDENNLRLFTGLMHAARHSLVVATPYFVPDDALMLAITNAARRGVKVTLINSQAVDQTFVVHAQRSFYAELLRAGVDVRLYPAPTLLHAKAMVVDDDLAAIGSSNLDIRSFTLNMEVSVLLYGENAVGPLRTILEAYAARAVPVDLDRWRQRPFLTRAAENLARLTAALQ